MSGILISVGGELVDYDNMHSKPDNDWDLRKTGDVKLTVKSVSICSVFVSSISCCLACKLLVFLVMDSDLCCSVFWTCLRPESMNFW